MRPITNHRNYDGPLPLTRDITFLRALVTVKEPVRKFFTVILLFVLTVGTGFRFGRAFRLRGTSGGLGGHSIGR